MTSVRATLGRRLRLHGDPGDGFFEFESEVSDGDAYFVMVGLMRRSVRNVRGGAAYYFDSPSGICESSAVGVGLYAARQSRAPPIRWRR